MQPEPAANQDPSETDDLGTAARRQRILDHLRRQSDPTSEHELAARIAAGEAGSDAGTGSDADVSEEDVRDVHVALRHVDLPKAKAAGVLSWDESTGTVEPAEGTDLCETEVRQLFSDGWDDADAVSQHERRRAALALLRETEGQVSLDDLAAEVAAHETDDDVAPAASDVDEVGVGLHHRHLPRLQAASLVEYDPVAGTVVYTGPSADERRTDPDDPVQTRSGDHDDAGTS